MTDQQRWDALGCAGGWVQTPALDRVAAEGVRFANAYTNSPVCVPARASLMTGRYPHNTGVWRNQAYTLPSDAPTWIRAVRDAGYRTSLFGKTHLHPHRGDLRDREHLVRSWGFDDVDEIAGPRAAARCRSQLTDRWERAGVYDAYRADLRERYANKPWVARPSPLPLSLYADVHVGQQAAAYLREYVGEEPWCCWVSFGGPHEPWDAPEPYASRYDPASMPAPIRAHDDGHDRPRGLPDEKLADGGVPFEPGDVARLRANYAGKVTLIDDQIADILRVVDKRGELDRTVVAFVSDHGEMNGDHNLLYKQNFLNPAVRVPFIVRLPPSEGAAAGTVSDAMVELMDIGATLVELAGGRAVHGSLARSLVPAIADPSSPHRDAVLSEFRREAMVANADWKLAVNRGGEAYMLYDLQADPLETRNLAGLPEYREVTQRLTRSLERRVSERPPARRGRSPLTRAKRGRPTARWAPEGGAPATLHFLHVGKTGGTAIKQALRRAGVAYWRDDEAVNVPATPYGRIRLHNHGLRLSDVAPEDRVFFCLRDPIDRFLSAFYSRLHKGQPRYYFEWTDAERQAFEAFPSPQRLARALASEDAAERSLAHRAMRDIRHMNHVCRVVGTPAQLRSRLGQVVYVARQETLSPDWEQLKHLLQLPPHIDLPVSRKSAHRRDPSLDATLDARAIAALKDWYRGDYLLLRYCDALRAWRGWGATPAPHGGPHIRHQLARIRGAPVLLPRPPAWIRRQIGAR
jgi:choline-sulfatase